MTDRETVNEDDELTRIRAKLVSPNGLDGNGPVPEKVTEAARTTARLRVKFVSQWMPGADHPMTTREIDQLFDAAAIDAEWMRELYEARDAARFELDQNRQSYEAIKVWSKRWWRNLMYSEAENAKLRDELDAAQDSALWQEILALREERDAARAREARVREFVDAYGIATAHDRDCDEEGEGDCCLEAHHQVWLRFNDLDETP